VFGFQNVKRTLSGKTFRILPIQEAEFACREFLPGILEECHHERLVRSVSLSVACTQKTLNSKTYKVGNITNILLTLKKVLTMTHKRLHDMLPTVVRS
jgi:hypothetical protein